MKYLLTPMLLLSSTPILAHPGHAAGQFDYGYVAVLIALLCVIAALLGHRLLARKKSGP